MRHRPLYLLMAFCCFVLLTGCSSKLTRRQAKREIDEALKSQNPPGAKKLIPIGIPGFDLASEDDEPSGDYFLIGVQGYEPTVPTEKPRSPNNEDYLREALASLGYITVEDGGPVTKSSIIAGNTRYSKSRTIRFTTKAGTLNSSDKNRDYSSGFSCYPAPNFEQCNIPSLIDVDWEKYQITGIVQDDTQAKVSILIPFKLSPFAVELKPFAADIEKREIARSGVSDYYLYPALYGWGHYLNSHKATNESPATLHFQKFDDGWRIVDENGKSLKDYIPAKN